MVYRLSKCKLLPLFILFLLPFISFSQVEISGIILNKKNEPLSYANLTLHNLESGKIINYAVTDEKGKYSLRTEKGKYEFRVSYLGYKPILKIKSITENTVLNFTLIEDAMSLDEIEIKSKSLDVSVKNDTTKYNVKRFITGNESNLKDVLNKLPGIEVDDNGKIKANGKKIDKLLVDGKELFGDQHQLATENISSEMIKNVSFLSNFKGFSDLKNENKTNKTALNIEIKEEYKGKIKGNVLIGGGIKDTYEANSNLFLFNKNTNLSFIGSINNIGNQTFTLEDYISFQGGVEKFMGSDNNSKIVSGNELPSYLLPDSNFKEKKELFSALNFSYNPSDNFNINSYIIFDKVNSTEEEFLIQKSFSTLQNIQLNINRNKTNSFFVNNTFINTSYKLSNKSVIEYFLNYSPQVKEIKSIETFNTKKYDTDKNKNDYSLSQLLKYKQAYKNSTLSFSLFSEINNEFENINLLSDEEFLNLTFKNLNFSVSQDLGLKDVTFGFSSLFNYQITPKTSTKFSYNFKKKSNNFSTNTNNNNFKNDTNVNTRENIFGLSIFNVKKVLVNYELGIRYNSTFINNVKNDYILPFVDLKFNFRNTHYLSIGYKKNVKFPNINQIANSPFISNFNTLISNQNVNPTYENLLNNFSLQYFRYDLFSGTLITIGGNLTLSNDAITTNTKKTDNFRTDYYVTGGNDKNFTSYLLLDKKFGKIPFSVRLKNSFYNNNSVRFINDKPNTLKSKTFSNNLKISSNFKTSKINFDIGYNRLESKINTEINSTNSKTKLDKPFLNIYLDLDRLKLKLNKSIKFYKTNSVYRQYGLDFKLDYITKNRKIIFFLKGSNILNINNSFSVKNTVYESYVEDRTISNMQGYGIAGIKYKF